MEHDINYVILEDIWLKSTGYSDIATFKTLAGCQMVLAIECHNRGIKFQLIKPNEWRAWSGIGGGNRAKAKASALAFGSTLGIKSEDESEAVCICRGWINANSQINI